MILFTHHMIVLASHQQDDSFTQWTRLDMFHFHSIFLATPHSFSQTPYIYSDIPQFSLINPFLLLSLLLFLIGP